MDEASFFEEIQNCIAENDLSNAMNRLRTFLKDRPQLNEVLQQSGRYTALLKQIRLGTVDFSEKNLVENQIRASLLGLLDEIQEKNRQDKFFK